MPFQQVHRFIAGCRLEHGVAGGLEKTGDELAQPGVVFREEDGLEHVNFASSSSPGSSARLDKGVKEHAVRVAPDSCELLGHPIDGLLRDFLRRDQRGGARKQELGPEAQELGALSGGAIIEVEATHIGLHVAESH
jgi:hypothetical protein